MRRVVGVDAGYVNFAVCMLSEGDFRRPVYWNNSPLFLGKFSKEKLASAVYEWITKPDIKAMLESADLIVLEKQFEPKYEAVNHCIRFRYWDKTTEVAPATMSKEFSLPMTRKEKKKAAVELVSRNAVFPIKKGKKDDLADAYLLALRGLFSFTPKIKEGVVGIGDESGARGRLRDSDKKKRAGGQVREAQLSRKRASARKSGSAASKTSAEARSWVQLSSSEFSY
jgi:hypothetical protein